MLVVLLSHVEVVTRRVLEYLLLGFGAADLGVFRGVKVDWRVIFFVLNIDVGRDFDRASLLLRTSFSLVTSTRLIHLRLSNRGTRLRRDVS